MISSTIGGGPGSAGSSLSTGSWTSMLRWRTCWARMKMTRSTNSTSIIGVMLGSAIVRDFPVDMAISVLRCPFGSAFGSCRFRSLLGHRRHHACARIPCDPHRDQHFFVRKVVMRLEKYHLVVRLRRELDLEPDLRLLLG